jgi:phenylacetate-CoA ligase
MTPEIMQELWESILAFSPRYLFGFPSAFSFLAEFVNQKGYDGRKANLLVVVTTGETLHKLQEDINSNTFGCPVANEYGSSEAGVIAYSHPCGALHTMDDGVVVEVIRSSPEDEFGEVVVTNLDNWGFPIIRYNHNDLAKNVERGHECSLGLGFGTLEGLIGRSQDSVRLASGRVIYCYYFHHLIQYVGGVKQFQFVQKKPDLFELKVIPKDESFGPAEVKFIRDAVRKNLDGSETNINIVDNIPGDPSGKLRYVISEL